MTLLDAITTAAAALDAGDLRPSPKLPEVLDASSLLSLLKPQTPAAPSPVAPIRRLSLWHPPSSNSDFADKLERKLRSKLKNKDVSIDRIEIIRIFDSFAGERWDAILGGETVELVLEACARSELWDRLENLILKGFVKGIGAFALVEKLVEKNRADLLCVTVRRMNTLRPADLLAILRFFLNPTRDSQEGMLKVRKEWERQGLLAIEKASEEGLTRKQVNFAREAAVLVMMAHDGFTSSESCLHHVFSSPNAEGLVMSTAVSRLRSAEVLRLVRYLGKWLEKYERFPEVVPCKYSKAPAGLVGHEWVPSLQSVVNGLSLILDEHFSYLAMNPELHELLKSMEKAVKSLASAANACHVLAAVLENLASVTEE